MALKGNLIGKLKRFVLRSSDTWTSNTCATSEAFGHDTAMPKPHIIPMGVDVKRFHSGDRTKLRRELPENDFIILFVGHLIEEKGLTDLLAALTFLPPQLQCKTSLWVVGDGQYRTRLQKYAETLGISEKFVSGDP